jgi:hypothetical protein
LAEQVFTSECPRARIGIEWLGSDGKTKSLGGSGVALGGLDRHRGGYVQWRRAAKEGGRQNERVDRDDGLHARMPSQQARQQGQFRRQGVSALGVSRCSRRYSGKLPDGESRGLQRPFQIGFFAVMPPGTAGRRITSCSLRGAWLAIGSRLPTEWRWNARRSTGGDCRNDSP